MFDKREDCYNDMRNAALAKMKWNTQYEEDLLPMYKMSSNEDYIGYSVKFHKDYISHYSYSGEYVYTIHEVDDDMLSILDKENVISYECDYRERKLVIRLQKDTNHVYKTLVAVYGMENGKWTISDGINGRTIEVNEPIFHKLNDLKFRLSRNPF
jgi:hypothetical protein